MKRRTMYNPDVVYRNNKPVSVIIDIDEYEKTLEILEDLDDLKYLEKIKKKKLNLTRFDDFISDIFKNKI